MVDILLTDGQLLPTECEQCLKDISARIPRPVLGVHCTGPIAKPFAMLVGITTDRITGVGVVGATEVVMCPRK